MIISRTPFRISFFGGGTDYRAWYAKHGGAVLSTTIDKYCYITCRYLPPFFEHRYCVIYSKMEYTHSIDEIAHPAVREVLRFMKFDRGLELHHDADLPARSGMGSSSAFTVGFLHALYALQGRIASKQQLATEAIHVEQELLKETVGSQDQASAAYGGFNHIVFSPSGDITVRPITLSTQRMQELNSHLMLFYSGIKRTASDVAETYVNTLDDKRRQLRIMKEMVDEGISILNSGQDIRGFGELLHEAWQAKRSLGKQVSNSQVDQLYDDARSAGAIGGKLIGAGGGGFMMLFVPPEHQAAVKQKLGGLISVPFKFEFSGSQIIFCDRQADYQAEEVARASQTIKSFEELRRE